jgi:hypothetical protein
MTETNERAPTAEEAVLYRETLREIRALYQRACEEMYASEDVADRTRIGVKFVKLMDHAASLALLESAHGGSDGGAS